MSHKAYNALQRICLALPDSFVSPRMWTVHASLLCDVLTGIIPNSGEQFTDRNSQDIRQALLDNVSDIKKRNEAMLFREFPVDISIELGSAVTDIKVKTFCALRISFRPLTLRIQVAELHLQQIGVEQPTLLLTLSR